MCMLFLSGVMLIFSLSFQFFSVSAVETSTPEISER